MIEFRLKVFQIVAEKQNFTKAANILNITQPAVSKHIKEIENQYNVKLFDRNGTKIKITKAGEILLNYTQKISIIYHQLENELLQLNNQNRGILKLGASTTIAQYCLPEILAEFKKYHSDVAIELIIDNSTTIENLINSEKIDLGLVENSLKSDNLSYSLFKKDEIVLVTNTKNKVYKHSNIKPEELEFLRYISRENGSGTLETIINALNLKEINYHLFKEEIQLENTESIKRYLLASDTFSFLSIHAIIDELKNNSLRIIDIDDLEIYRDFNFIQPIGQQNKLVELFIRFCLSYNQK